MERGLYAVSGSSRTWHQRAVACVLRACAGAAVSHLAAAWLLRLVAQRPNGIEVTVPYAMRAGGTPHRAKDFSRSDIRIVDGIPVTCPARTLIDIASLLPDKPLAAALDTALLKGLVSLPALRRYVADRGLGRKRGVGRLLKLVDDREFGVPESELEREFLLLIRRSKLPKPERQKPVGRYRVDFAYPDARLLIEVDGRANHGTAQAFEDDPLRQNALVLAGWTVLRFTWKQVTQQPEYVVETIRALTN
jgi:very-short-patch-repair endonuclease